MPFANQARLPSAVGLAVAAALLLGGCGSDSSESSPGSASTSTTSTAPSGQPQVSAEFRQCLEDQGVQLPSGAPTDGSAPSIDPGLQEALEACASLAPTEAASGAPGGAVDQSALDAFADCMNENGVNVDASLQAVTALDQTKPKISKALDVCAPLIQPG